MGQPKFDAAPSRSPENEKAWNPTGIQIGVLKKDLGLSKSASIAEIKKTWLGRVHASKPVWGGPGTGEVGAQLPRGMPSDDIITAWAEGR